MVGRPADLARPRPRRSRHLLRTRELAAELVRDSGVGRDDVVLEIGAGGGRLTEQLARVAGRVIAVEIDAAAARRLRGRWGNVEVVEGDAVAMTLPSEPFRVVANLPFHRTADLLRLLLDDPRAPLLRADLVVEWDVAVKRALPWPSSVTGVVRSAFYEASVARRLTSEAFVPAPAVDAGVLVLRRRRVPLVPVAAADDYRRFVAAGFRRGLVDIVAARAVRRVAPGRRAARDLDAHEWAALFVAVGAAPAAQRSRSFDRSRSSSR